MRLGLILEPVAAGLEAVEARLSSWAAGDMPVVSEAVGHVVGAGGKRLRPACLLLAAGIAPPEASPAPPGSPLLPATIELAAAVEIIHTASLVHDDIIDGALVRRGRGSLHARWGQAVALLVGDLLYSRVFRDLTRDGNGEALRCVTEAVHRMVLGELAETCARDDLSLSEAEYLEIVGNKTAALFACATYLGARAGGLSEEEAASLRRYGEGLGVTYQIVDDVLDLCEDEAGLGKPAGADLRDGKVTLPVIHALTQDRSASGSSGKAALQDAGRVATLFREKDGIGLREAVLEAGSVSYALGRAEEAGREAAACLERLSGGPRASGADGCLGSLLGMVEYVVGRGREALERGTRGHSASSTPARPEYASRSWTKK